MLRYLLDTNIVSEPMARQPTANIVERLKALRAQCAIAAPAWQELQYGCIRLPAGIRRTNLQSYLGDVRLAFKILPYDESAAHRHAIERARLAAIGRPTPFADGQIAAIALVNELVVVTRDFHDFAPFAVTLEDWANY